MSAPKPVSSTRTIGLKYRPGVVAEALGLTIHSSKMMDLSIDTMGNLIVTISTSSQPAANLDDTPEG
jgi:hypothetical protein